MDPRTRLLNIRMSERELEMLKAVAEADQLTASEWIRHRVRAAYEQLPKPRRPKR